MQWLEKRNDYIKKFALFPITIKHETRWLETVYIYRRESIIGPITSFTTKEEYEAAQAGRGRPSLFSYLLGMKWGCRKKDEEEKGEVNE